MRFRATLIYIAAVLVFAGAYYYDLERDKEDRRVREEAARLLQIQSDPLVSISLKREGKVIRLERNPGEGGQSWMITRPIRYPADDSAVEKLKAKLGRLKYSRIIAENGGDLSEFGLDSPSLVVDFCSAKNSGSIAFGDQDPTGYGYYARTGKERIVYLVRKDAKAAVDKEIFDLRDKKLFSISRSEIEAFVVYRPAGEWALKKDQGKWSFEGDPRFDVDSQQVDSLVSRFIEARISSVVKEKAEDLKAYGLQRPGAVVTVIGAGKRQSVAFGAPCPESETKIYAAVKGSPQLFTVNKRLLTELPDNKSGIQAEPENNDVEGESDGNRDQ